MDEKAYWLAFSHVKGIGAVRFRKLLNRFGDLSKAWNTSVFELIQAGLPEKTAQLVVETRKVLNPLTLLEAIDQKGIKALTWNDPEYPKYLEEIAQPPPVLYYQGSLSAKDELAVAIVGTRNVTGYGKQVAKDTATLLAANGITIVSGLARGVDAIAHQAALDAGGRTLAILGSGVDVIYPPEHRKLAQNIAAHGAVMSDYPPGTKPEAVNFPPRNRIISGLARATIVIEAGERSGALITARFSMDQGRDVFAVPGSVTAPMSRGTNQLLVHGAIPMTSPLQVLQELGIQARETATGEEAADLDPMERRLLQSMGSEPIHIDDLCNQLDMPVEKVSIVLTMMEIKGLISRESGNLYRSKANWI